MLQYAILYWNITIEYLHSVLFIILISYWQNTQTHYDKYYKRKCDVQQIIYIDEF